MTTVFLRFKNSNHTEVFYTILYFQIICIFNYNIFPKSIADPLPNLCNQNNKTYIQQNYLIYFNGSFLKLLRYGYGLATFSCNVENNSVPASIIRTYRTQTSDLENYYENFELKNI